MSETKQDTALPRNTKLGEFWFGRALTVVTFLLIIAGVSAAMALGVRGADLARLVGDAIGAWLVLTVFYQARALGHDRLADVIRAIRGR